MPEAGFCRDCASWRFEENPQFQSEDERDGFGVCTRVEEMGGNRTRALARCEDEFSGFQTRGEYGCLLFQPR